MPRFLIIKPDFKNRRVGRGAQGRNLYLFLKTYFGKRSVSIITRDKLSSNYKADVDHLFIGIPSYLCAKDISRIGFKNAHLYDYEDEETPNWMDSDQDFLRSITSSYFKSWTDNSWDNNFKWSCLPIRRHINLNIYLNWIKLFNRSWLTDKDRIYDSTFFGNAVTGNQKIYNGFIRSNRMEWINEINRSAQFKFHVGLIVKNKNIHIEKGNFPIYRSKFNYSFYFNSLLKSRTALAPPGNARWSYRHYESIYAGAIPITSEFYNTNMLVPLPNEGMAHVRNGDSVISALDFALKLRRDNHSIPSRNINHLEKYLKNGIYNKHRHKLIKRFIDQLDKPSLY